MLCTPGAQVWMSGHWGVPSKAVGSPGSSWNGEALVKAFAAAGFPSASGGAHFPTISTLASAGKPLGFGGVYPLRETSGYRKDFSAVLGS